VDETIERRTYTPLTTLQRVFLWMYILSFCFDFKGVKGGTTVQYIYAGASIFSTFGFFMVSQLRASSKSLRWITSYWWLYIAVTFVTVILGTMTMTIAISPIAYSRIVYPYILCGASLLMCQQMEARNSDAAEVVTPLVVCGIFSAFWHYYYGLHGGDTTGAGIEDVRYQILSPATPLLLAYGLAGLIASRKITPLPLIALFISVGTILLSITRGFIITGGVCFIVLMIYVIRDTSSGKEMVLRRLGRVLGLFAMAAVVVGGVIAVRPNTFDSWNERIFNNSGGQSVEDATYLIRMAEVSWDWQAISSNPQYLLTGKGVGAGFNHDSSYQRLIVGTVMDDEYEFFPADCTWSYAMFSSGLIFGTMMLGIYVLPLIYVARSIYLKEYERNPHFNYLKLVVLVCLAAYFSMIFTSAPFAERFFGVIMGFLVGLAYWTLRVDLRSFFRAR
jgi:hypothetical protein